MNSLSHRLLKPSYVNRVGKVVIARQFGYGAPAQSSGLSISRSKRSLPNNTVLNVVPQAEAWVVEKFGKFDRILDPGLHFLVPFVHQIKYVHSLKETTLDIPNQQAITKDNVTLQIDGVLFVKVEDPRKASYEVEAPQYAIMNLAQTTMRSEIGKLPLDKTFEERERLNANIVEAIAGPAHGWGLKVLRYEIRDIKVPTGIQAAMELQAEAERRKRQQVLQSEGEKESRVNVATGERDSIVLSSEAEKTRQINSALGEAAAIEARARAVSTGIREIATAIAAPGGTEAVALRIAEQYVQAFSQIAQRGNTIIVPANAADPSAMVTQALTIFDSISNKSKNVDISKAQALDYLTKQAGIQQYLIDEQQKKKESEKPHELL